MDIVADDKRRAQIASMPRGVRRILDRLADPAGWEITYIWPHLFIILHRSAPHWQEPNGREFVAYHLFQHMVSCGWIALNPYELEEHRIGRFQITDAGRAALEAAPDA